MREKTYKVYGFDELPKEVQEKAIERFRESNLDYDWWDASYDDFSRIAEILGIDLKTKEVKLMNGGIRKEPAIYFSGFYSQGDGACFEGTYQYAKGSVKKMKAYAPNDEELHRIAQGLYEIQKKYQYRLTASVKHSGHYYHSGCTHIEVDLCFPKDEESLKELLRDFMKWIYHTLEKEYSYLQSDEQIVETIKANEYEFTEDGKIG